MSFVNCRIVSRNTNPADYHAAQKPRGDAGFMMSPSALKEFARCPSRWRAGYAGKESTSKDFGSLVDCGLLTPEDLTKRYVCQPDTYEASESAKKGAALISKPWNNNATACKEWTQDQKLAGKIVVTKDALDEMAAAVTRLLGDTVISDWHAASDKQVLVEGQWQDEVSELVVPVRCLIDYAPRVGTEFEGCLGDLKTAFSGALKPFNDAIGSMGYHLQASFDLALFNAATGESREQWCFIGLENYPPYEPFKRVLDEQWLQLGRERYINAMRHYCQCLKANRWPGYDDHPDAVQGWSLCSPPQWMLFEAESDRMRRSVDAELTTDQKLDRAGL